MRAYEVYSSCTEILRRGDWYRATQERRRFHFGHRNVRHSLSCRYPTCASEPMQHQHFPVPHPRTFARFPCWVNVFRDKDGLNLSAAHASTEINALADRLLTQTGKNEFHHRAGSTCITKSGIDCIRDADVVVDDTYRAFHSPLPAHMKSLIDSGFLITKLESNLAARLRNQELFVAYEAIRSCLGHKLFFTNNSRLENLSFAEFRVGYRIFEEESPIAAAPIADRLLIARPVITATVKSLEQKGAIHRSPNPRDKRSSLIGLTQEGASKIDRVFSIICSHYSNLRPGTANEVAQYADAASIIVATAARNIRT